ncbi:hypothetical protein [Clostridium sp. LP20]|uniref:hypothetical protein n=1 Tax=Clostridium sp. LP20 TaxID=3418665 RepID=UPI003EE4A5E1
MRVKEICSPGDLGNDINKWLDENKNIKIMDIKYSALPDFSGALIVYEEIE